MGGGGLALQKQSSTFAWLQEAQQSGYTQTLRWAAGPAYWVVGSLVMCFEEGFCVVAVSVAPASGVG